MTSSIARLSKSVPAFIKSLRNYGLKDKFNNLSAGQKGFSVVTSVTLVCGGIAQLHGELSAFQTGWDFLKGCLKKIADKRDRETMIGLGVADGLAWLHYYGYLQHVLKGIEKEVNQCQWYTNISEADKKRMPIKLYELIPRKCFIDILRSDDKITQVSTITIEVDDNRKFEVPIYCIEDEDETKYYCICECPFTLKTIQNVNDIQMAGISRSMYSDLTSSWFGNAPVQLFTVDKKLVQLMRFYYTLNSILSMKINKNYLGPKARLILFNEENEKLSNVLLRAIKEDVKGSKPAKELHGSLMANKLLSAEERKDVFYDFDVFVTHPDDFEDTPAVESINKALKDKQMKVLSEDKCIGKDWGTKLKYAATKCRWIVFVDKKESKNKLFMSSKLVDSLKIILESRKVQTVIISDKREGLYIHDDLRWVTCIPYEANEHLNETLYNILSGFEVTPVNLPDFHQNQGEVALGLAWNFAANNLSRSLPEMHIWAEKQMLERNLEGTCYPKYLIFVPESCITKERLGNDVKSADAYTECSPGYSKSYDLVMYNWDLTLQGKKKEGYCVGQYARQVEIIRHMTEVNLLSEEQMKSEVEHFTTLVDKIMEILRPEEKKKYAFVFYDDKKETKLEHVMLERILIEKFTFVCQQASTVIENM